MPQYTRLVQSIPKSARRTYPHAPQRGERLIPPGSRKTNFDNEIPDPRDVTIICLINTCDVFRFIFQLDEEADKRIEFICRMELIGRSIGAAVSHNLAGPLLRHSALSKRIPTVSLRRLLFNRYVRHGNVPALFADLANEYGPVFEIRPPFAEPMIFLAGPETNRWVHRRGRMYLRAKDCFNDFERVYGASGVLPSLDGADHFRLRKSMSAAYSRGRLVGQLDQLYFHARKFMSDWKVGGTYAATPMSRRMINAQMSPLSVSVNSLYIIDDLMEYKERALNTHIVKALPKFMLNTPAMKRRAKAVDTLLERVQSVHTSAQRAGSPRDLADDIDRYRPPRNEHFSPGYAPYGLGTHMCLGFPVDGAAARRQRTDGRILLQARSIPLGLQAPVQPASVDEAEQEA